MLFKKMIRAFVAITAIVTALSFTAFADSGSKEKSAVDPIRIVVDSDYILYKVNDPVTRKTKQAYIVRDNAEFRLLSDSYTEADAIFYINEFVDGQDTGVSNRVLKKKVHMGETVTMLPEDVYEEDVSDGSAYRFTDRCYYIKVFYGPSLRNYEDFYFGLVDDSTYDKMYQSIVASTAALEEADTADVQDSSVGPVAG